MAAKRHALADRRQTVGHTQESLAALLGVERSTVVRWEAGETEPLPWCRPKLAECGDKLIAFGFGRTLPPTTSWWSRLVTPLPDEVTREYDGRTFVLIELLVRKPWRRKHVAETIHHRLMHDRPEERATLTVLPAADAAQAAYAKWGWHKVAQTRNPLPGSPIFDVLVKDLL